MGQAFDGDGNVLGGVLGDSFKDVLEKMQRKFPDAARVEIGHMAASTEMPRYRCHKDVHALKIVAVQMDAADARAENRETDGSALLLFGPPYAPLRVTAEWLRKHTPEVGGYYVAYKDGYTSFSPADAFETGYTQLP